MVVINGNKYKSKMLSQAQEAEIFFITWLTWEDIGFEWSKKSTKNMGLSTVIENQSFRADVKINSRVKLLCLCLCETTYDVILFFDDLQFMSGDREDVSQIMKELYPTGFYSKEGSSQRWSDYKKERLNNAS